MGYRLFVYETKVGDEISSNKYFWNMELLLVDSRNETDCILVYDDTLNNLYIYDLNGELIYTYNFYSLEIIRIVSYSSSEELVVYLIRSKTFVTISSEGKVLQTISGNLPETGDYYELSECNTVSNTQVCIKTHFMYYSLNIGENEYFHSLSAFHVIYALIGLFVVGKITYKRFHRYD